MVQRGKQSGHAEAQTAFRKAPRGCHSAGPAPGHLRACEGSGGPVAKSQFLESEALGGKTSISAPEPSLLLTRAWTCSLRFLKGTQVSLRHQERGARTHTVTHSHTLTHMSTLSHTVTFTHTGHAHTHTQTHIYTHSHTHSSYSPSHIHTRILTISLCAFSRFHLLVHHPSHSE